MLPENQVIKQKTDQQLDSGVNMDGTSYRKDQAREIFAKGVAKINQAFRLVHAEKRHQRKHKTKRLGKVFFFTEDKRFYATRNKRRTQTEKAREGNKRDESNANNNMT